MAGQKTIYDRIHEIPDDSLIELIRIWSNSDALYHRRCYYKAMLEWEDRHPTHSPTPPLLCEGVAEYDNA